MTFSNTPLNVGTQSGEIVASGRRPYVAPSCVLLRLSSTAGGAAWTSDSTVHVANSQAAGYNKYQS